MKISQKSSRNYSNGIVEKTLEKFHLEYCIPFPLDLFSESTQTGTGTMKTHPGTSQGINSLLYKTLEELQQSKGWESLWFLTINTVRGQEGKSQTVQLEGQSNSKICNCKLVINRSSPEMRAKFLVTRGMTKKTTHRGRQQQMLLLFGMRSL